MGLMTAIPFTYLLANLNIRVRTLQDSLSSGMTRFLEYFKDVAAQLPRARPLRRSEMDAGPSPVSNAPPSAFAESVLVPSKPLVDDARFDVTAMVDLVFMMNIFFLVTWVDMALAEIDLPDGPALRRGRQRGIRGVDDHERSAGVSGRCPARQRA